MRKADPPCIRPAVLAAVLALLSGCDAAADDPDAAARDAAEQRSARRRMEIVAKAQTDQIMRDVAAEVLAKRLDSLEVEIAELRREIGVKRIEAIVVQPPPMVPADPPAAEKPAMAAPADRAR